jgi:hypothetical protein
MKFLNQAGRRVVDIAMAIAGQRGVSSSDILAAMLLRSESLRRILADVYASDLHAPKMTLRIGEAQLVVTPDGIALLRAVVKADAQAGPRDMLLAIWDSGCAAKKLLVKHRIRREALEEWSGEINECD